MKTYITSDLHFGHQNICNFCPVTRAKYNGNVQYMNETMVKEWNEIVNPEDTVYILGDVAMMPSANASLYINQLNGSKILIEGNHDFKLLKDPVFRNCFKEVHQYLTIYYDKTQVCMFHYPIAEWDQMYRGSVHFHGHLHGHPSGVGHYRSLDVGMDATGQIVLEMEEAIRRAMRGEVKGQEKKEQNENRSMQ